MIEKILSSRLGLIPVLGVNCCSIVSAINSDLANGEKASPVRLLTDFNGWLDAYLESVHSVYRLMCLCG